MHIAHANAVVDYNAFLRCLDHDLKELVVNPLSHAISLTASTDSSG